MKIFLDFDDFLFRTERGLVPDYFQLLAKESGQGLGMIEQTYKHFTGAAFAQGDPYTLERHVALLAEQHPFDTAPVIAAALAFHHDIRRYLYPGAQAFLKSFSRDDLILLTYGAASFQNLKINGSGIRPLFREVIITRGNKLDEIERATYASAFLPTEKRVFGDNRSSYFEGAKERGVTTIHLKRAEDKFNSEPGAPSDFTVDSFEAFRAVVSELEH